MYDVTNRNSFEHIGEWLIKFRSRHQKQDRRSRVSKNEGDDQNNEDECLYYIVGNKIDVDTNEPK